MMKWHGVEMRDSVEADANEGGVGFIEAVNAAVEEALSKVGDESELIRRKDVKEAVRVGEDDYIRRNSQEEE